MILKKAEHPIKHIKNPPNINTITIKNTTSPIDNCPNVNMAEIASQKALSFISHCTPFIG